MDQRTRDLRNACEPIGANVYFAPEAHQRYTALGLDGGSGYFCSRGASLGKPSGMVVAAAFGVFSPAVVVPLVTRGWSLTEPEPLLQARYDGATTSLRRLLVNPAERDVLRAVELLQTAMADAEHAGHPLFSGLKALPWPDEPIGQLWRSCDMLREHRGDSHIAVWTRAGVRPIEIQLMSELQLGIPLKTYSATRGWTVEQMDTAIAGMRAKGWMDGDVLSPDGLTLRERIENETDVMEVRIADAIGNHVDELLGILRPWASAIVRVGIAGGGYPGNVDAIASLGRAQREAAGSS